MYAPPQWHCLCCVPGTAQYRASAWHGWHVVIQQVEGRGQSGVRITKRHLPEGAINRSHLPGPHMFTARWLVAVLAHRAATVCLHTLCLHCTQACAVCA